MRVAYVVGWPEGPSSGPFKKIKSQLDAWTAEGVDARLYVLTIDEHAAAWRSLPAARSVRTRSRGPRLALEKEALIREARRWNPDVIYHRWSLTYPGLVVAAQRSRVVLEINTDDIAEYDRLKPPKGQVNRLTRGLVLRRAAGAAFVTDELARASSFSRYQRPSVVIANGIDLSSVPEQPPAGNTRPRVLFIGQPNCPWHGLDKLAVLARRQPGWGVDVVGPTAADLPGAPANITFHGLLQADEYTRLLGRADVGVGSLALHRNSMNEASPLKVREYLATGLPAVIGYVDTDFPHGADFLLSLPNTENNVADGVPAIEKFVTSWMGRRVPRGAVAHLDHRAKERARIAFFASLT